MSDPAKSPDEIEDVLASIRRLVSDTGSNGGEASANASADADVSSDRLVLGPSLRVADADPASDDVSAEDQRQTEDSAWQHDDLMADFDAVGEAAEVEDTPDGAADYVTSDDPIEAETGEAEEVDPELAADESFDTDAAARADAFMAEPEESAEDIADLARIDGVDADIVDFNDPESDSADFESETGDENWPSDGAEAALLTLAARRDQAQVSDDTEPPSENASDEEDQSDIVELDSTEVASNEPVPVFSRRATAPDDDASDASGQIEDLDETDTDDEGDISEPDVSDDMDMPEAGAEETDAAPVPEPPQSMWPDVEVSEENASSDDQPNETEDANASVSAADMAAADASGLDATIFAMTDGEAGILDEETLREIIVDVVREELQGVLGQRITRNVRKMVRREIRLALAAQSLEQ